MTHNLNVNGGLCEKSNIAEEFRKDSATDTVFSEDIIVGKTKVKEESYDFDMPTDDIEFGYIKEEYICSSEHILRKENLRSMKSSEQSSNKNVEDITVTKTEVKEECYDDMPIDDMEFGNIEQEYISLSENNFRKENLECMKSTKQSPNEDLDVGNGKLGETHLQTSKRRCELYQSDFDENMYLRGHCEHCPLACVPRCGFAATQKVESHRKNSLVQHSCIHTNEKPFRCTYKDCRCTPEEKEFCKCDMCGYEAARKYDLHRHVLVKHSGKPKKYKCRDCKYTTHTKNSLVLHSRIHTNEKPWKCTYKDCRCVPGQEEFCKCDTCGFTAAGKSHLKRHVLGKHSAEPKKYKCRECNYATYMKNYLAVHSRIHSNEKPFRCTYKDCRCAPGQEELCKCDTCEFTATGKYSLKRHILVKHSGEPGKYKCRDCKYATHTKTHLVLHSHIHSNEKPFRCTHKDCKCAPGQEEFCKCGTCGFTAAARYNLKRHVLVKHSGEPKKYKCRYCKFATHSKESLTLHSRIHTNEKPFKCTYKDCKCAPEQEEICTCDTCGYATSDKANLKKHVLVKHSDEPRKYKCRECKYATHMKSSLLVHSRIHTNEKPFRCTYKDCNCAPEQKEFCKCGTCGFTTSGKHHLKRHVLVKHSSEQKKYNCRDCKYATHTKSSLVIHNRIHTNEKPFRCTYKDCRCVPGQEEFCKCDMCAFTASTKYSLKRHVLRKHSGEPKNTSEEIGSTPFILKTL